MLPGGTHSARPSGLSLYSARFRLYALRWARERPTLAVLLLLLFFAFLLSRLQCTNECRCAACGTAAAARSLPNVVVAASRPSTSADAVASITHDDADDAATATSMSHIVVGVMTAHRFHRTRCAAQSATWLRRARRVVFFSDAADGAPSDELHAPVVAHRFQPAPTERIFAGGNWRAVPILRTLAERFFSAAAQEAMRARHEPLPRWTFMLDDDAYVFAPQMLAELAALDADEKHYLGYAFIAAPHLEGDDGHHSNHHAPPRVIMHAREWRIDARARAHLQPTTLVSPRA